MKRNYFPRKWLCLIATAIFASPLFPASTIAGICQQHLRNYPCLEISDLYKLCYQAAMGNAHIGVQRADIMAGLNAELSQVEADADQPLSEEISPSGQVVRINLRPFKAKCYDANTLAEAVWLSARYFKPSVKLLRSYWQELETAARTAAIPFTYEKLAAYFAENEKEGFPAVHHSDAYMTLYRPAYRVIMKKYMARLR
jgi:hypothetical protein